MICKKADLQNRQESRLILTHMRNGGEIRNLNSDFSLEFRFHGHSLMILLILVFPPVVREDALLLEKYVVNVRDHSTRVPQGVSCIQPMVDTWAMGNLRTKARLYRRVYPAFNQRSRLSGEPTPGLSGEPKPHTMQSLEDLPDFRFPKSQMNDGSVSGVPF